MLAAVLAVSWPASPARAGPSPTQEPAQEPAQAPAQETVQEPGVDPEPTSWAERLPAAALASYVAAEDRRILVAAAGGESSELDAVSAASREQLQASGRFDIVMDSAALGSLAEMSDREIISAAAGLPVDIVLVLRVFEAASGSSLVATAYALDGTVSSSFSLAAGAVLSPSAEAEAPPKPAAEAPPPVAGEPREITREEQERELKEHTRPRDLVRRSKQRRSLKTGLMISGGVLGFVPLVAGAVLVGIVNAENCFDPGATFDCGQSQTARPGGIALATVGSVFTVGFIVGAALPKIDGDRRRASLIGERSLAQPARARNDPRSRWARALASWRVAPTMAVHGAGVAFTGRF